MSIRPPQSLERTISCILAWEFFSHYILAMPNSPVLLLGLNILSHFGVAPSLALVLSPDSYILLPLIASQVLTLEYLVPTLLDLVDPQI